MDNINEELYQINNEGTGLSLFEEEISKTLLIEALKERKAEVFENVVFDGKRRYYIENLSERDYCLENTTPYQLEINGEVIEESSWGELLRKVSILLLKQNPSYNEKVYSFQCPWSKQYMYSQEKKTNYKEINENLFINCNHTALHSCWFLQDLLDYFLIDKNEVKLLIHRPSSAEPKKIKEYIDKRFRKGLAEYIRDRYNKSEEYSEKVVNNIEKYLNPILRKYSKSYTSLFLFDDNATMMNYIKKIRLDIESNIKIEQKTKVIMERYLDYLVEYYKA